MNNKFRDKKGQGVLETAVVFVCFALLIGGIMQIWLWGNNQIVRRQRNYNATRRAAGTAGLETFLYIPQWPAVPNPAFRDEALSGDYNPLATLN